MRQNDSYIHKDNISKSSKNNNIKLVHNSIMIFKINTMVNIILKKIFKMRRMIYNYNLQLNLE